MTLSRDDEQKLRHMLGAEPGRYPKNRWGFRNHYATSGGDALEAMRRMETAGLVVQGCTSERMTFFHATEAGCKAIGMTASQIKRAMED